jgi:hypothetical protein
MLRFQPDTLLEGLLRPFVMSDPNGYVYLELMAPDWRPAVLAVLLAVGLFTGRAKRLVTSEQTRLLVAFLIAFYAWTFGIGNGRYFLGWLLVLGPLLVLASRWLPGTREFRWALLALLFAGQAATLRSAYMPSSWSLTRWTEGPGIEVHGDSIQSTPAVFVTISGISYSILAARFHPASRWANVAGQNGIPPGSAEYEPLVQLLSSDLPKYILTPARAPSSSGAGQPQAALLSLFNEVLARYGLSLTGSPCEFLPSPLSAGHSLAVDPSGASPTQDVKGFWACPLQYSRALRETQRARFAAPDEFDAAFEAIEDRCPRFAPRGEGVTALADGIRSRHYVSSDSRIMIDSAGNVFFRYLRSLNPTLVGNAVDIKAGKFTFNCERPAGRYRPPWLGDERD